MRYTILGATGFIGRHLVDSLRAAGHEVFAPQRDDPEVFSRQLGHVLYCIGMTADFRRRPFDTVRSQVSILADILEKAAFDSLLYLSSTRVYARAGSACETTPLVADVSDPSDLYNLTKLTGESLCRSCGRKGVKVVRLSNVVGHGAPPELFLFALIREALAGHIELQTDSASAKDYILIDDVVRVLPRIAADGSDWLYNVASGQDVSHQDIIERLSVLTACSWSVRPGSPVSRFPAIDITRIRREFDFAPASVLEALPRLVNDLRTTRSIN